MKALQTEISNLLHSYIAVVERNEPYFKSPYHYHPELELVYVKESHGKRIIGDKLDTFTDGDMVFMGSNLPHVWLNDEIYYKGFTYLHAQSIVVYFNKEVFSKNFYELKESSKINDLFNRASRGIRIMGETQKKIAIKMEKLVKKKDFDRIICLMELLNILATSKDIEYITNEGYTGTTLQTKTDRLSDVYKYITTNYYNDISLDEISKIANLSPTAFCRLFKQRTNRHFVEYLNEVRISNACKFLLETNLNVSEIAFQCGYKTLSNFNKIFKKTTALSPKEYRQKTEIV
ncbi:helix-turn-helix domain-containing protein [Panacibacter ginsenosidivorans]|uniref:Helix-turn-helix domain-containing protein n=1 Tax=Panacibacter ginsenosidivorans TaxID=1813871 RepID=A0A5B8V7K3_9BACT|nr:AraC family transcriptional regulator [Panacibacter ginsenosidivorans]QEC67312.1 helix-turn-helix domain-containing protein [Panacibacter ginsenosidivorans]